MDFESNPKLKKQIAELIETQSWEELDSLYEKLASNALTLVNRFYYEWERILLLSTVLEQPLAAIHLAYQGCMDGASLEVMVDKIEEIRRQSPHLTSEIFEVYTRLLDVFTQPQTQAVIRPHWEEIQSQSSEVFSSSFEALPNYEDGDQSGDIHPSFDPEMSSYADDAEEMISLSEIELIEEEDTELKEEDSGQYLITQLSDLNFAQSSPLEYLESFEALIRIRTIQFHEQAPLAKGLWKACSEKGYWQKWTHLYERFFARFSPNLTVQIKRTFLLAHVYENQLHDSLSALEFYLNVLELMPEHARAFQKARSLLYAQQDERRLIQVIKAFITHNPNLDESFELCIELGDLYRDFLQSPIKAIACWFQALEYVPESRQVFVRLLEIYQQNEQWGSSIKVLRKLIELEEEHTKRAYYTYTVGLIQRDQIKDDFLAIHSFNEALDIDPHFLKAFSAIQSLFENQSDPIRQDRYFRKMLLRSIDHQLDSAIIAQVAVDLGHLNFYQLNQLPEAAKAYQLALHYRPQDTQIYQQFIEVQRQQHGPKRALQDAFQWIRRHPTSKEAYQKLFALSLEAHHYDWAWCSASVLKALKNTTPESIRFHQSASKLLNTRLERPLSQADWRLVRWSGQNQSWGKLLALSLPALHDLITIKPKKYKVNLKKDRLKTEPEGTFGRVVHYVAQCLNVKIPTFWVCSFPHQVPLELFSCGETGIGLSENQISSSSLEKLTAYLTYALYLNQASFWMLGTHQEKSHILRLNTLVSALNQIFREEDEEEDTLTVVSQNGSQDTLSASECAEWANRLAKLPKETLNELRLVDQLNSPLMWIQATEQTAYRLALVLSGSLDAVIQLMHDLPSPSQDPLEDRLYKLLLFAVSRPYLELRQALGLNLQLKI